jgi:hypothetical protein
MQVFFVSPATPQNLLLLLLFSVCMFMEIFSTSCDIAITPAFPLPPYPFPRSRVYNYDPSTIINRNGP